jgi:hypothetical protein
MAEMHAVRISPGSRGAVPGGSRKPMADASDTMPLFSDDAEGVVSWLTLGGPFSIFVIHTRPDRQNLARPILLLDRCPYQLQGHIFNKESGMLGLTGMSNDMRNLGDAAQEGNERADLSGPGSRSRVLVVPTNEELMITKETYGLAK